MFLNFKLLANDKDVLEKLFDTEKIETHTVLIGPNEIKITTEGLFNINYYPSGKIKSANLSTDQYLIVGGRKILFKSILEDKRNPRDWTCEDYSNDIYFHESGEIKQGILAENTTINIGQSKYLCAKDCGVTFFSQGAIKAAVIIARQGIKLKNNTLQIAETGSSCDFDEAGNLWQTYSAVKQQMKIGNRIFFGQPFTYYPDGSISSMYIKKKPKIKLSQGELVLHHGGPCSFDKKGNLITAELEEDSVIRLEVPLGSGNYFEINVLGGSHIYFYEDERIEMFDSPLKNIELPVGNRIYPFSQYNPIRLYPNGTIKSGTLSRHFKIGQKWYQRGSEIYFDENGEVARASSYPSMRNVSNWIEEEDLVHFGEKGKFFYKKIKEFKLIDGYKNASVVFVLKEETIKKVLKKLDLNFSDEEIYDAINIIKLSINHPERISFIHFEEIVENFDLSFSEAELEKIITLFKSVSSFRSIAGGRDISEKRAKEIYCFLQQLK